MTDALISGAAAVRPSTTGDRLDRIAEALGCPVAAFYTGEGLPAELVQTHELLTLWGSLKGDASRQSVLKLLGAIVAAE